jgi:hypothetical protein
MLREFPVTQSRDTGRRRWFVDDDLDLIVWLGADSSLLGFRLCYDKCADERALTWTVNAGYQHHRVDTGESSPMKNQTPILIEDGPVDSERLRSRFVDRSSEMDPKLRDLVIEKIARLPPVGGSRPVNPSR